MAVNSREAGRRCSDLVRQKIVDGHAGRWLAIRLSDGGSDGVPYDSRRDAILHQLHESLCAYVKIPKDNMPEVEAIRWLEIQRQLYDNGLRMIDPEQPDRDVIMPEKIEDLKAAVDDLYRKAGLG